MAVNFFWLVPVAVSLERYWNISQPKIPIFIQNLAPGRSASQRRRIQTAGEAKAAQSGTVDSSVCFTV